MRAAANPVVHIDDDRFRVTEWQFAPGAETGWHRHGHDYVIVPLCDGQLVLDLPGGQKATASLTQGVPYSRRAGVEHNVTNGSDSAPLAFLEVEVVDDALGHRRQATMIAMMAAFNARDVEGVMACMSADCAFHASAGPEVEGQRYIGRDAVRQATAAVFDAFPEAAWTDGMHVVAGDKGLSSWRFVGRRPDGSPVDVRGCDVFGFDGDLIAVKDSYRKARG
ncbi:nuclear transport factor 2 family protein [Tabrizicola sp. BL-A-41-H6]|uniref:nuclear transport factor 2 family protein n=1 Tax=Tabrizicola sp. BL-A-41-H6 TaxID=3421107 RepID=UPI003D666D59